MKNPHTNICQPLVPKPGATCFSNTPSKNTPTPRIVGTAISKRSRKRSSGYLRRSLTRERSAAKCRPPNRAALHRRGTQQSEDELPHPRGLEGTVREIAVIEARDGEHAHHVERRGHDERDPAEAHPDDGETSGMHQQEGDDPRPVDMPARVPRCRSLDWPGRKVAVAEPARQLSAHTFHGRWHCWRFDHDFIFWSHQVFLKIVQIGEWDRRAIRLRRRL